MLKSKNDKEREYLQRTIIMMELKQLAESITLVVGKKKLKGPSEQLRFKNRPILWSEKIDQGKEIQEEEKKTLRIVPSNKRQNRPDSKWTVPIDKLYCVRFDSSINLKSTWVDGKIMNFFNAQRDNIFASSSKYDIVQLKR